MQFRRYYKQMLVPYMHRQSRVWGQLRLDVPSSGDTFGIVSMTWAPMRIRGAFPQPHLDSSTASSVVRSVEQRIGPRAWSQ